MNGALDSERGGTIRLILIFVLAILWGAGSAIAKSPNFGWDKEILFVQIDHVDIEAHSIDEAWLQITKRYLIRINIYTDKPEYQNKLFAFNKDKVTGKEILNALLSEYPEFTYTQNPDTGIIWIHPKKVAYGDLLNQKIRISHDAKGVPMYPDIYLPLSKLLRPDFVDSSSGSVGKPPPNYLFYDVELTAGTYSAREILDLCCSANPSKAFWISQSGATEAHTIYPMPLAYPSPVAPPRVGAVRFWELGIGKSTNGIPTYKQIREAMASRDPQKRLTASLYLEACDDNYSTKNLLEKAEGADQSIWTALGAQYAIWRGENTNFFSIIISAIPRVGEDLKNIKDPCLAVLVSLQLTRESKDTSYVDQIVSQHSFTNEEIDSIKPEIIRMARSSNAVREKIRTMHLAGPEFSQDALRELENTNFLEVVPSGPK